MALIDTLEIKILKTVIKNLEDKKNNFLIAITTQGNGFSTVNKGLIDAHNKQIMEFQLELDKLMALGSYTSKE